MYAVHRLVAEGRTPSVQWAKPPPDAFEPTGQRAINYT